MDNSLQKAAPNQEGRISCHKSRWLYEHDTFITSDMEIPWSANVFLYENMDIGGQLLTFWSGIANNTWQGTFPQVIDRETRRVDHDRQHLSDKQTSPPSKVLLRSG